MARKRKTNPVEEIPPAVESAAVQPTEPQPDTAHAEKIRETLQANVGKLLVGMRKTNAVPPQFRSGEKPILGEIARGCPLVDGQGKTCLMVGSYYVYLISSDQASEFDQESDNELVLDFGSGKFVAIVQV